MEDRRRDAADIIISLLVVYSLLGLVAGGLQLPLLGHLRVLSGWSWKAAAVLALCCAVWRFRRFDSAADGRWKTQLVLPAFGAGLALLLFSDFVQRRDSLYYGESAALLAAAGCGAALAAALLAGMHSIISRFAIAAFFLLCQAAVCWRFFATAGGRLVFGDDHSSFLYRLQLLDEQFPRLLFYNTDWNAGYITHDLLLTGPLGVYVLAWPLLRVFGDIQSLDAAYSYTLLLPYLFFVLVPLAVYAAARLWDMSAAAAAVSGLLALGPTELYWDYALKYGTLPFCLSAGLFPLVFVIAASLFLSDRPLHWKKVIFGAVAAAFCLFWLVMSAALLPVVCTALINARRVFTAVRLSRILVFIALTLALTSPVLTEQELWRSRVPELVSSAAEHLPSIPLISSGSAASGKAGGNLREQFLYIIRGVNPLILVLFVPALAAIASKEQRRLFYAASFWLMLLALFGPRLIPRLELHRMVIPLAFLLTLPVGKLVTDFVTQAAAIEPVNRLRRAAALLSAAVFTAALIGTPFKLYAVAANDTGDRVKFAPDMLPDFVQALRTHGGEGRVFFTGFILHDLGAANYASQDGGHVGPLAAFSGKQLYASHFFHYYWQTLDPIPQSYRRRPGGIEEFLDLMNVSSVITFRREWANYCRGRPNYREVFSSGRFRMFVREGAAPGYFLKGQGELKVEKDGLSVMPQTGEAVLKFKWDSSLAAAPQDAAELFPYPAYDEDQTKGGTRKVFFIGLRFSVQALQKQRVTIRFSG